MKNIARAEFLSLCGLDPGKFKPRPLLTAWRTQVGPTATSGSCQERTLVSDGHVWINWRDLNNDLTGSAPALSIWKSGGLQSLRPPVEVLRAAKWHDFGKSRHAQFWIELPHTSDKLPSLFNPAR